MGGDYYKVMGLNKECTEAELKAAYRKLALKWHPDRCSDSKLVEDAKRKFQAIQEAYSVLSDVNKRFLYDLGVYDSDDDDDDQAGMADFMTEMAVLMGQNKPNENGESFEELKDLFEELFQDSKNPTQTSSSSSSSNKRASSANEDPSSCFDSHFQGFSLGAAGARFNNNDRRKGRHA